MAGSMKTDAEALDTDTMRLCPIAAPRGSHALRIRMFPAQESAVARRFILPDGSRSSGAVPW